MSHSVSLIDPPLLLLGGDSKPTLAENFLLPNLGLNKEAEEDVFDGSLWGVLYLHLIFCPSSGIPQTGLPALGALALTLQGFLTAATTIGFGAVALAILGFKSPKAQRASRGCDE